MNADDRRSEIINILRNRRFVQSRELADRFEVTDRTIRNDIKVLTFRYPIWTQQGRGGGIFMDKETRFRHRPYGDTLEYTELETLIRLYYITIGRDRENIYTILKKYGPADLKL